MATKHLYGQEALKKLKSLAENAHMCMMLTALNDRPIATRPMTIQEVDENGILWFISSKSSDKNHQLTVNSETQVIFVNKTDNEYLSVYGFAEIYEDQKTIDEKYSVMANAWFDGKDDPDVSIIGIRPEEIKYWDTKYGSFVDFGLMVYAAVTGNKGVDGGEEGQLKI